METGTIVILGLIAVAVIGYFVRKRSGSNGSGNGGSTPPGNPTPPNEPNSQKKGR